MKIFSASQIKACDAYTIHAKGMQSVELMERAAIACTDWITSHFTKQTLFVVLCGTGNNGGDGLAITRLLHNAGYGVKAFQLAMTDHLSPDCRANLVRLRQIDGALVEAVPRETYITDIPEDIVLIDAIVGTGLNRRLDGWLRQFVQNINQLPNKKISIDIPAGMPADTVAEGEAVILNADHTLSFQFYKRSFLHPETGSHAGEIHILDIDLEATFITATHTNYHIADLVTVRSFFRKRSPFSHKGTFGTALLIGGSHGMMGAISLTVMAASRGGAGKIIAIVPRCGYEVMQTLAPESLCRTSGDTFINTFQGWEIADSIGIGPGMGSHQVTADAFEAFLEVYKEPLVLDADALNILAERKELLNKLPANTILTPHPKEFERMFGETSNSFLRLEHARTQAMRYNIIIVLKGRYTTIIAPDGECWYNMTGNAGLATGGSGDVLTGVLTSLLAQNYEPLQAALLGVYLHGLAATKALDAQSEESMIPRDVIECLGKAFRELSDY